jgi:hypothetical protein
MRVSIPVPTSVLLCDYKLGFGLVVNQIENLKNFKIPSVWGHRTVRCAPDTALCTVRCTGSRTRRSHFPVRCPVGHQTATVRCPVCTGQAL